MIAYVSGEASRGVLLEGGQYYGFILDEAKPLKLSKAQLPGFFFHAWDVERYECPNHNDFRLKVELLWKQSRAVSMALIAFDEVYSDELRFEAAHCAEDSLQDQACLDYLLARLYAYILPASVNVRGVSDFLSRAGSDRLEEIFDSIVVRQDAIKKCVSAWDDLPDSLFESPLEREEIRIRIVRTGAFYKFASSDGGSNEAIFRILSDPILAAKSARSRDIFNLWATHYKEVPSRKYAYFDFEAEDRNDSHEEQRRRAGFEVFQQVKRQISTIKREYAAGRGQRADVLVNSLVESQRRDSSSEHLAKSLCNLAVFLRDIGDVDRYYSFSLLATEEAPSDAWAHTQFGNACIARSDFAAAMVAFEKSQIYGDERSALIGRAEVLKYLGQKDEAINTLEECIRKFPNDEVARNSRASVYAHFGYFGDALDAYNRLAESPFASAHVFGGRAAVLSGLGNINDAINDEDRAIILADRDDAIPHCAKADLLRETGRFGEAINVLDSAERNLKTSLPLGLARARVVRDEGNIEDAQRILCDIQADYPYDVNARVAVAELYRRRGQFDDALLQFLEVERSFSYSKVARNSTAATFAALGRFEEALNYLPSRLSCTRGDWVGQHIRAMIEMKRGNLVEAKRMLDDGLENCPWKQQRPFFASALASCYIRARQRTEAISTIESVGSGLTSDGDLLMNAVKSHAMSIGKEGVALPDQTILREMDTHSAPLVSKFMMDLRSYCANTLSNDDLFDSEWRMLIGMAA